MTTNDACESPLTVQSRLVVRVIIKDVLATQKIKLTMLTIGTNYSFNGLNSIVRQSGIKIFTKVPDSRQHCSATAEYVFSSTGIIFAPNQSVAIDLGVLISLFPIQLIAKPLSTPSRIGVQRWSHAVDMLVQCWCEHDQD